MHNIRKRHLKIVGYTMKKEGLQKLLLTRYIKGKRVE